MRRQEGYRPVGRVMPIGAAVAVLALLTLPGARPVAAQSGETGGFYNGAAPPVGTQQVKPLTVVATDQVAEIAPGVKMSLWTFNGSVPGPIFHVRQGMRFV